MTPRRQRERYQALRAMVDGATTPGERTAAQNALDRHVERWGEPEGPDPDGPVLRRVTFEPIPGRFFHGWGKGVPMMSPTLGKARAPDGAHVLMSIVRTRKAHRCVACQTEFPKGARLWRPIAYNGNHRMHRLCPGCYAPDPEADPALEDQETP